MVKQELVNSLREMEGIEVKDEGNSGDHSRFWELRSVWTFLEHWFGFNIKTVFDGNYTWQILFSIFSFSYWPRTFEFRFKKNHLTKSTRNSLMTPSEIIQIGHKMSGSASAYGWIGLRLWP